MRPVSPDVRAVVRVALALAMVASLPADLRAQRVTSFGVRADNDGFNYLSRGYSDRDYTAGTEFALSFGDPLALQRLAGGYARWCAAVGTVCTARLTLGQKIFTPSVESPTPVPGERPFAGWLYLRLEERVVKDRDGHRFAIEVGVTGKPSLAEAVSQGLHDLIGFHQLVGWDNQLRFEPGFALSWDYDRSLADLPFGSRNRLTVTRTIGMNAGTALTEIRAGAALEIGIGMRTAPDGPTAPRFALFASALERLVLRNLFLDGNTFTSSVSVAKRISVFSYSGGAAIRLGRWEGSYAVTTSAREYDTQSARHAFSTFAVSYRFR